MELRLTAWGGMACQIGKFLEVIDFRGWVERHLPITESSPYAKGVYEKALGYSPIEIVSFQLTRIGYNSVKSVAA